MKHIKLTSLVFGLLLFGCNKADIKKSAVIEEKISTSTDDKTQRFDITILVISPDGFPCEMNVNGNKLISHDAESLLEQFKPLLSSAFVGDKIRKLMKKGA